MIGRREHSAVNREGEPGGMRPPVMWDSALEASCRRKNSAERSCPCSQQSRCHAKSSINVGCCACRMAEPLQYAVTAENASSHESVRDHSPRRPSPWAACAIVLARRLEVEGVGHAKFI